MCVCVFLGFLAGSTYIYIYVCVCMPPSPGSSFNSWHKAQTNAELSKAMTDADRQEGALVGWVLGLQGMFIRI